MARCHAQFEKIEKFDKIESIYGDIREDIY